MYYELCSVRLLATSLAWLSFVGPLGVGACVRPSLLAVILICCCSALFTSILILFIYICGTRRGSCFGLLELVFD